MFNPRYVFKLDLKGIFYFNIFIPLTRNSAIVYYILFSKICVYVISEIRIMYEYKLI
jgi:hypothetical protein